MSDDFEFGVPDTIFTHLDTPDTPSSIPINYDDFVAKKSDEYFISIAKSGVHSFIMLGVVVDGQKKILTSVGKYTHRRLDLFLLPFISVNSSLYDDRENQSDAMINYSAYAITYQQALSFITLIVQINKQQNLHRAKNNINERFIGLFKPIVPTDNAQETETVTFQYDSVNHQSKTDLDLDTNTLCKKTQYLSKFNTCRHTGVDLLNYTRKSETPYHVSRQYFLDLPVHTNLVGGVPNPMLPFYILPLPSTAFPHITANAESAKIMAKLYRRMEVIITLKSYAPTTETKFNKLKSLYNDLANPKEPTANNSATPKEIVTSILDSLSAWRKLEANKDVFQLRKTYFFIDDVFTRKSATEKMFDEFNALNPR